MAIPAANLSSRRSILPLHARRPHDEHQDRGAEDDALPDREVERLEPVAPMSAKQEEGDDADEIEKLYGERRDENAAHPRFQRGVKGEHGRAEEQHRLDAVAAVLDVDR